jgi:hypothetical protein
MGQIKSTFHDAVERETIDITVFVLMEGDKPTSVYADKKLAEQDCWLCNESQKYLDMEQFNYWVKAVPFYIGSPD